MSNEDNGALSNDFTEAVKELSERRAEKKALKNRLKELEPEIEEWNGKCQRMMEVAEIQSVKLTGIGTVFMAPSTFPNIAGDTDEEKEENRLGLINWMRSTGNGALVKPESINLQTLRGFINERLEKGEEIPPGVGLFTKVEVRVRASK